METAMEAKKAAWIKTAKVFYWVETGIILFCIGSGGVASDSKHMLCVGAFVANANGYATAFVVDAYNGDDRDCFGVVNSGRTLLPFPHSVSNDYRKSPFRLKISYLISPKPFRDKAPERVGLFRRYPPL